MLSDTDRKRIRAHGLTVEEVERQLRVLSGPPAHADLIRPCTIGDGLVDLPKSERADRLRRHEETARAGRYWKFVPASGAASRMFGDLLHYRDAEEEPTCERLQAELDRGVPAAATLLAFLDHLDGFAFHDALRDLLARRGEDLDALRANGRVRPVLHALLSGDGLGYATIPKGMLPFHAYAEGVRTPLQEHLVEAAELVRDAHDTCRVHFTVAAEHEGTFREHVGRVQEGLERSLGVRFEVSFSTQSPATDTVALDAQGLPFRTPDGELLFRASGHGALLLNLARLGADLALIKNVDNVAPDRLKGPTLLWSRLLLGHLSLLQERSFGLCRRLEADPGDGAAVEEALALAAEVLHRSPPTGDGRSSAEQALHLLHRPLRVCGMVPNEGEPGGGPFWVRASDGSASLQVVESAQVDLGSAEQRDRFAAGTHFHPVFLACGLRDHHGRPFDLARYVDPGAAILTQKSSGARELLALERPGLWNGAMARWNTVFMQVPGAVFNPVKTLLDLLRPEHRSG